ESSWTSGPHSGACDVRGVVARGLATVILRVGTSADRCRTLRLAAPELTTAQELALETLVAWVTGVDLIHVVVDPGVEDRDHDAGAVESQLLADAQEEHVVLGLREATGIARAHDPGAVMVGRVLDWDRLHARDTRQRQNQLDLSERRV